MTLQEVASARTKEEVRALHAFADSLASEPLWTCRLQELSHLEEKFKKLLSLKEYDFPAVHMIRMKNVPQERKWKAEDTFA